MIVNEELIDDIKTFTAYALSGLCSGVPDGVASALISKDAVNIGIATALAIREKVDELYELEAQT